MGSLVRQVLGGATTSKKRQPADSVSTLIADAGSISGGRHFNDEPLSPAAGYILSLICLDPGTSCLDLVDFRFERLVVFPGGHLVLGLFGTRHQPGNKAYGSDHRDAITNL